MNATIWLTENTMGMALAKPNNEQLIIYNTPASTHFIIKASSGNNYTLNIYDLYGQKMMTKTGLQSQQSYSISLSTHGIFPYLLIKEGQVVKRGKIIR